MSFVIGAPNTLAYSVSLEPQQSLHTFTVLMVFDGRSIDDMPLIDHN